MNELPVFQVNADMRRTLRFSAGIEKDQIAFAQTFFVDALTIRSQHGSRRTCKSFAVDILVNVRNESRTIGSFFRAPPHPVRSTDPQRNHPVKFQIILIRQWYSQPVRKIFRSLRDSDRAHFPVCRARQNHNVHQTQGKPHDSLFPIHLK